jgi:putative ABC transport system permease protein
MFKNFILGGSRNLWRNRLFSLINISGLAIGISASLVIFLIVNYQYSFDRFEKERDRIYRVVSTMHFPGQEFRLPGVPLPMSGAVQREVSGVEISAPVILFFSDPTVGVGLPDNLTPVQFKKEPDVIFTNDSYFKLISYNWLAGNPGCLQKPFSVVLTESRAKKYFPEIPPSSLIGHTLTYDDSILVTINGVVQDLNEITEFRFKEFLSLNTIPSSSLKKSYNWDSWSNINSSSQLFVKLIKGASAEQVLSQIQSVRSKYYKDNFLKTTHSLQPLNEIHFDSELGNFDDTQANKSTLLGLLVVAAFLLLLGCINFINLTTAQGTQRAKEIGIRKTLGSSKKQLIFQFLSETFLLTFIATGISIVMVPLLLKAFSSYIPAGVSFNEILQPGVLLFIIIIIMIVGLLSGFYPALTVTRLNPVAVLKNQIQSSPNTRKAVMRKTLTIVQFIIAQFFIFAILVVSKQIHYLLNKELGFKKEAIVTIDLPSADKDTDKKLVLRQKISGIPEVDQVVLASFPPASNAMSFGTMSIDYGKKKLESSVEFKYADSDYFALYKMKLLAGRFPRSTDSTMEYLINNTYAQVIGFKSPSEAIGKYLERGNSKIEIVGVLADFHSHSLHSEIKPLVFSSALNEYSTLHIGLKPKIEGSQNWKSAISKMEKLWKEEYPEDEFSYQFLDESIAKFYKSEQDVSILLSWATGLTIFISCLGLLGLAVYTTNLKTKEIGIRKVLGASVNQIVFLLSRDFVQLILFAFVISAPFCWWAMNKWLEEFAFRTTLDWWVFAVGGLLMVSFALLVLSIRTIRSASANPIQSLRTE